VAAMIHKMVLEGSDEQDKFEDFLIRLAKDVKREFPDLKPKVKPPVKSQEQLQEEALTVKQRMSEMPPIPEKEGEVYHIVAIDWWKRWQAYTGYENIKLTPTGDDTASTSVQCDEDVNGFNDGLIKSHHN
jgi:hypothetical protein